MMYGDEGTPKIWSVDFKLDSAECQLPQVPCMHVLYQAMTHRNESL
jgi:hypothetical protein